MIIGWIVHLAWRIRETDVEFLVRNLRERCANMWDSYAVLVLKVICSGSMKLLELAADRDTVLKNVAFPG